MHLIRLLLFVSSLGLVASFCPSPSTRRGCRHQPHRSSSTLLLTTEEDVLALVEKAEDLWAQVEKLRNKAKELSLKAENLGQDAETSAADAIKALSGSISEDDIKEATNAQNLSIDLGSLVEKAAFATEEADKIEELAEKALADSETALEQYLIDFPEDDEIDTL